MIRTWFVLSAVVLAGCQQQPIGVVPQSQQVEWRSIDRPRLYDYKSLSGTSASNIFALASWGLGHYDGVSWTETNTPNGEYLQDVWTSPGGSIHVVSASQVLVNDAGLWTVLYDHGRWALTKIWGASESDIYVTADEAVVHFDGSAWMVDTLGVDVMVRSIWGVGGGVVFAAGRQGWVGTIYRNDGSGWEVTYTGDYPMIGELWGSGPDDVYAASGNRLLHYNGAAWLPVDLPKPIAGINAIWGTGKDDVFVFCGGNGGYNYEYDPRPSWVFHFNGVSWEVTSSGTSMSLHAAWGPSKDDIYAVGAESKIVHFDGISWSSVSGGWPAGPSYVWGLDANNVYVGDRAGIFKISGENLDELPTALPSLESSGLWGTSPDQLISVGYAGKVFVFNGVSWTRAGVPTSVDLLAVTGLSDHAVWVVGDDGTCFFYNGVDWIQLMERIGMTFTDVWAASPDRVFVVGSKGAIACLNGSVWTMFDTGIESCLNAVWGTSENNVFAAGCDGVLTHFDGSRWERVRLPLRRDIEEDKYEFPFIAVTGSAADDILALDESDNLVFFDGVVWNRATSNSVWVRDVWAGPNGRVFAVGTHLPFIFTLVR